MVRLIHSLKNVQFLDNGEHSQEIHIFIMIYNESRIYFFGKMIFFSFFPWMITKSQLISKLTSVGCNEAWEDVLVPGCNWVSMSSPGVSLCGCKNGESMAGLRINRNGNSLHVVSRQVHTYVATFCY